MNERIIHPAPAAPPAPPAPARSDDTVLAWCAVAVLLVFQGVLALSSAGVWP